MDGKRQRYFFASHAKRSDTISLGAAPSFSSQKEYSRLIKSILSMARKSNAKNSSLYGKEIRDIQKGKPLTERAAWGGVALKNVDVEKNSIRKLLVIRKLGVLGFEYHRKKHEHLRVVEGLCLIFHSNHRTRNWRRGMLEWRIAKPGDRFYFRPFDEHGMVAFSNTVIEERSTNNLDDLVFVYKL
ncbi:MAG: hypothetical protein KGI00_00845 [Candidatus Micrarchaeota archaeon]|nr:hypothetical protein [Candidatus Micrarchaeota archaeon]MDE1824615.1 hypothetical protein [Candidatus Micrarchaeota archaeon]MDE1849258.1 hypothetical protein [Candidatus Micrarchaeota archaeon]